MHEVPGFFAFTSANSAFAALEPEVSICASCKPVLLCSDGCGAAAVTVKQPKTCTSCAAVRAMQHTPTARASRVSRGADVAEGRAQSVAEQTWQRGEPSQSRSRRGRGASPVSRGADVAEG